jgi:class 3 adenylate cyclase
LKFVNKISSIVHKAVYRYGGSANKNIGEAFLLVWKIPEGDYSIKNETNEIAWHNKESLSILADFSVYSFIKILIKINKSPEVLEYRNDYRLLEKIPGYKVEMGFGLHIGWAIEGAIGSAYKIDASYLSPNVNMASRLEAATKQFGVNFLISESLHEILTPEMQGFCRNIDRVTVKGSNKPIRLYTVDMNLDNLTPPQDKLVKYPNIPDYQPDIELKRDINMQFMKPEEMKNYNAEVLFLYT